MDAYSELNHVVFHTFESATVLHIPMYVLTRCIPVAHYVILAGDYIQQYIKTD